jgi:hypothetical protein
MTTLPVSPTNSFLPGTAMLPFFVDGGGWRTQIMLMNPNDTVIRGSLWIGSQFSSYLIMPRSAVTVATPGLGSAITSGVVYVAPNATPAPVSSAVFSFVQSGLMVSQTGVPFTASGTSWSLFAENGDAKTGIALANTDLSKAATIQVEVLDMSGRTTGYTGSFSIAASAQTSMFINQIPGLEGLPSPFRGILHITSDARISVVALRGRYNERGDFLMATSSARAEEGNTYSEEFLFPHIVTGGGFLTEIILLNWRSATNGTVKFFSQSGTPALLPISTP